MFHVPNVWRVRRGPQGSDESYGNNGAFIFPATVSQKRASLFTIASDGDGWEHVSISTQFRVPTWAEMCFIKSVFWDAEDCVVQFHPRESEYVNQDPFCLHLWRCTTTAFPEPPAILVGIK
jgi:hypothetical protein